jgi:phospholipase/carboxylesterase
MTDLLELSGPALDPASGGAASSLVILLHGVGADGNDLIGLAPHLARVLPDTAFVSPNAPYPCDMAPMGYQWFSIQTQDTALRLAAIRQTSEILNAFIDAQLAAHGLSDDRLALVGFSQGTMMSLFIAPRRDNPCAGIMAYSGRLEGGAELAHEIKSRPPVMMVHGDQDELLPVTSMTDAAARLVDNGLQVETHVRPGLGHGIDEVGLQIGMSFLAQVLAGD